MIAVDREQTTILLKDRTAANLAVDRIEAYVTKIVADAPPFSEAQKARIAAIINGGAR